MNESRWEPQVLWSHSTCLGPFGCFIHAITFFWAVFEKEAAAAAKSLQSCPTLCDPIDGSPPGSPVLGILHARTLEWIVISFSNAWKWKVKLLSCVWLLATPGTAAYQAPLSMGFSRQEYWSGFEKEEVLLNSFLLACQRLECNASMLVWLESHWGIPESDSVTTIKDISNDQVQYSHFTAGERETPRERKPLAWGHTVIDHQKNQPVSLSTSPSTATFPCLLRNSPCNLSSLRRVCSKQCCTGTCSTMTFLVGGSGRPEQTLCVAFANFYDVNTPTTAVSNCRRDVAECGIGSDRQQSPF